VRTTRLLVRHIRWGAIHEGFVAGLYGRVSEEDLVAEIERIETAPRSADVTVTDAAGRSVDPGDYVERHWLPAK